MAIISKYPGQLTPSSRGGRLSGWFRSGALSDGHLLGDLRATGLFLGLRRTLPVVQHLGREDNVESESSNKAVQNKLVVHLLQRSENPRQRSGEIIEHLNSQLT